MGDREGHSKVRILIAGGGFVGLYSALGLERRLSAGEADITLVAPESFMVYHPFLPEAASGNIEPRHVVVPLRTVLDATRIVTGRVVSIDHRGRKAVVLPIVGAPYEIGYDIVVVALGAVSRTVPVPGLEELAIGFKSVPEAIYLRNQILSCMDAAESTRNESARRALLTFVFVGGGYAGVEALAELEDLARDASRKYRNVRRSDMRWILVEAASEILPEMSGGNAAYALATLRRRDIEVYLKTKLESVDGNVIHLSNGRKLEAETLVWTTGVRPHPLIRELGWPVDQQGRLAADEYLRVRGVANAWTAGDCAAVPDLTTGGICPPTAQHALRQARRLAANVVATLRGRTPTAFRYKNMGGIASLGRYKGVARVLDVQITGFPAWWLHRNYHVLMIPTFNRKVRVMLDWTVSLFFERDVVQLDSLRNPRRDFRQAVGVEPPD